MQKHLKLIAWFIILTLSGCGLKTPLILDNSNKPILQKVVTPSQKTDKSPTTPNLNKPKIE